VPSAQLTIPHMRRISVWNLLGVPAAMPFNDACDPQAENECLRRQLDKAIRAGKRQATSFANGLPIDRPKKPGRKPGKDFGTKAHRRPPRHDYIETTAVKLAEMLAI
jgi:hypothetical protein